LLLEHGDVAAELTLESRHVGTQRARLRAESDRLDHRVIAIVEDQSLQHGPVHPVQEVIERVDAVMEEVG
jgi:hypothetical protein